jgi:hypothetical protein
LRELGGLADGMQYPAVTMVIRRLAKRWETDKALARKLKRLEKILFVTFSGETAAQFENLSDYEAVVECSIRGVGFMFCGLAISQACS